MKNRKMITQSLVDQYYHDNYFLVDTERTYLHAIIPIITWLRPLAYEINIDETTIAITSLLDEPVDKDAEPFGRCEISKVRIIMEINIPNINKKMKGMIEILETKFCEGSEQEKPVQIIEVKGEYLSSDEE